MAMKRRPSPEAAFERVGDDDAANASDERPSSPSVAAHVDQDLDAGAVAAALGLHPGCRVLLVGEGNFSMAEAIAKLGVAGKFVATGLECGDEAAELQGADRVERLRALGVQMAYGVDATDLSGTLPAELRQEPFDVVAFHFPQHPERRKIDKQRELLRGFFQSVTTEEPLLAKGTGRVVVSLCRGQGGTQAEEVQRKPSDTWQAQLMAVEAGLLLLSVGPCPVVALARLGYRSTGFRGRGLRSSNMEVRQDRSFNTEKGLVHIFGRACDGGVAVFPLEWQHDVSFWEPAAFREEDLESQLSALCDRKEVTLTLELLDQHTSPDGRRARTYRLAMSTRSQAITQRAFRGHCEAVKRGLNAAAGETDPR